MQDLRWRRDGTVKLSVAGYVEGQIGVYASQSCRSDRTSVIMACQNLDVADAARECADQRARSLVSRRNARVAPLMVPLLVIPPVMVLLVQLIAPVV